VRAFTRHQISSANIIAGTSDTFVAVNPYNGTVKDHPAYYVPLGSTYTGGAVVNTALAAAEYDGNGYLSSQPYSGSEVLMSTASPKIVGFAIRFRDTTPSLYRQGAVYSFTNGANLTLNNRSLDQIGADASTLFEPLNGSDKCWIYNTKNTHYDDKYLNHKMWPQVAVFGQHIGGLLFRGVNTSQFSGVIEVFQITEYAISSGSLASSTTSSPLDNEGGKTVLAIVDAARAKSMQPKKVEDFAKAGAVVAVKDRAGAPGAVTRMSESVASALSIHFPKLSDIAKGIGNFASTIGGYAEKALPIIEGVASFL
jgi:hypothetical protein